MTAPVLEALSPVFDYTSEDLELLAKLAKQFADGNSVESYLQMVQQSRLQIWRAGRGLILTQTAIGDKGQELIVYGIVGRGILSVLEAACRDLRVIAKTFQCVSIGGNVFRPGLARLYQELGAKPVFTFYSLELGHG